MNKPDVATGLCSSCGWALPGLFAIGSPLPLLVVRGVVGSDNPSATTRERRQVPGQTTSRIPGKERSEKTSIRTPPIDTLRLYAPLASASPFRVGFRGSSCAEFLACESGGTPVDRALVFADPPPHRRRFSGNSGNSFWKTPGYSALAGQVREQRLGRSERGMVRIGSRLIVQARTTQAATSEVEM